MEHALAEIPRVDRSAVTRLKNATGFPICEMVMKQFRKLRVDIDDAFSVLYACGLELLYRSSTYSAQSCDV